MHFSKIFVAHRKERQRNYSTPWIHFISVSFDSEIFSDNLFRSIFLALHELPSCNLEYTTSLLDNVENAPYWVWTCRKWSSDSHWWWQVRIRCTYICFEEKNDNSGCLRLKLCTSSPSRLHIYAAHLPINRIMMERWMVGHYSSLYRQRFWLICKHILSSALLSTSCAKTKLPF